MKLSDLNKPFFIVLIIRILCGAELDLFMPSFPELKRVFHVSTSEVELLVSANLIAQCLASLFIGSLGDKYGRKPVIITGLVLFCLGSAMCVFAPFFSFLVFGRILQGLGIAAPTILSYVILADIYSIKLQKQLMGILNGVMTVAMACAPIFGSYVNLFFDWTGNFYILLIFGIICMFTY